MAGISITQALEKITTSLHQNPKRPGKQERKKRRREQNRRRRGGRTGGTERKEERKKRDELTRTQDPSTSLSLWASSTCQAMLKRATNSKHAVCTAALWMLDQLVSSSHWVVLFITAGTSVCQVVLWYISILWHSFQASSLHDCK